MSLLRKLFLPAIQIGVFLLTLLSLEGSLIHVLTWFTSGINHLQPLADAAFALLTSVMLGQLYLEVVRQRFLFKTRTCIWYFLFLVLYIILPPESAELPFTSIFAIVLSVAMFVYTATRFKPLYGQYLSWIDHRVSRA